MAKGNCSSCANKKAIFRTAGYYFRCKKFGNRPVDKDFSCLDYTSAFKVPVSFSALLSK